MTPLAVDDYLGAVYRTTYNCSHFARDVWAGVFGEDISSVVRCPRRSECPKERSRLGFRCVPTPPQVGLVLMRTVASGRPHVGVVYNGRILHLQARGAEYVEPAVATFGYERVRYYEPC